MSFWRREPSEPSASTPPDAAGEPPADENPTTDGGSGAVPGERGIPSLNRVRSVQSRVSSVLAVTLMGILAAGLMIWYYSGAIGRSARAQHLAEVAAKRRAQGDTTLPSLGVIQQPRTRDSTLDHLFGPPPPVPVTAPEIPMANTNPYASTGPPKKTPEELELERQLGGPVLAAASNDRTPSARGTDGEAAAYAAGSEPQGLSQLPGASGESNESGGSGGETLASLLKPTPTPAVRARVLPDATLHAPEGRLY